MYNEVSLDNIDLYENFNTLESFYNLLQNPTYNVGQYVKRITLRTDCTMIWGVLLKYCPNIEHMYMEYGPYETAWNYVASAQKKKQ